MRTVLVVVAAAVALMALGAVDAGVTRDDFNKLKAQVKALETQLTPKAAEDLGKTNQREELNRLKAQVKALETQLAAKVAAEDLGKTNQRLEACETQLQAAANKDDLTQLKGRVRSCETEIATVEKVLFATTRITVGSGE